MQVFKFIKRRLEKRAFSSPPCRVFGVSDAIQKVKMVRLVGNRLALRLLSWKYRFNTRHQHCPHKRTKRPPKPSHSDPPHRADCPEKTVADGENHGGTQNKNDRIHDIPTNLPTQELCMRTVYTSTLTLTFALLIGCAATMNASKAPGLAGGDADPRSVNSSHPVGGIS